ncbi:hypothetical protein PV328_001348 [Microctonus aethiopoides]|uniref:Origin recognition complex subunit 1 n=1 Tax=Microctonus aethiopoides TaxID=144406 RepID=A0AA39KXD8_9HYME|nr:hypothetical protein PV328_001348 [Microctonus aethiopoides]
MSATLIDNKSFHLLDYYTDTSIEQSPKLLEVKQNEIKNNIKSKDEDSNLYQDNYKNPNQSIDKIQKTPIKIRKRKRLSSTSSSDDSSFINSPEIKFTPPIEYKLSQRNNTTIIIKKTMSRKPQGKSKKCNDKDIAHLLECDDDDDDDDDNDDNDDDDDDNDNEDIYDGAVKNNKEKTKTVKKVLPLVIRRSTDKSNYKITTNHSDVQERRASLRTTITLPTRYAKEDESTARKLSERSVRNKSKPKDTKNSPEISPRKTRTSKCSSKKLDKKDQNNSNDSSELSSKTCGLKSIASTPGKKKYTKNKRKVSTDDDDDEYDDNNLDEMNKENESEDSYHSDQSETITKQNNDKVLSDNEQLSTPQKKITRMRKNKTPISKTMSRIDEENDVVLHGTPKKSLESIQKPVTPKQKTSNIKSQTPSVKVHTLTPSMRSRKSVVEKRKTIFETTKAQLHVSAVPKSLPCREKEFNDVFTFLERKLVDHSGGCMYISGVPGTGKTATVNEAIRCLRKLVAKNTIEDFNFIEINGMKLSEPRQAYVQILKQLTGETTTWEVARATIEKKLTNANNNKSMTLLLIDELDLLCNKRQDVVYNLLDWPSQPTAKLVVITIANTMDLPERVLMSRVTSRLGLTRLTFQPYNHKQLQEIVFARLNESDAFKSDAIQLVARKVAAVSGDARRALDICRRATEIAEDDQSKIVSMEHVHQALMEMIANTKVRAIIHCSEMEKVFLQAVCGDIKRTGVEETIFIDVYKQFDALCSFEGIKTPSITESLDICSRLSAKRLILSNDAKRDIQQKIFLNVSSDDIHFALNNKDI